MSSKTKKNIVVSILLLVLIGAGFGYYLYNKGPIDVKTAKAINVQGKDLYQQFITDSTAAFKEYAGRIVQVSGEINSITLNQEKEQVISVKTNTPGAYINCTMEERAVDLKVNEQVTIKGICSGIGQGDPELGIPGDVYLTRCYLTK